MKKPRLTQAFTLIEVMVTMAIILVIASLILAVGKAAHNSAKKRKAETMIATLEVAISMYHADTDTYPGDDDGNDCDDLYDKLTNAAYNDGAPNPDDIDGWRGPYMEFKDDDLNTAKTEIIDPWGNVYHYNSVGGTPPTHNTQSFDLWSDGPDGDNDSGEDDDITNW